MARILDWLSAVVADLTSAAPPRGVLGSRDWMPSRFARTDLASPYFLAMADRDAGWYQDRHGPDRFGPDAE